MPPKKWGTTVNKSYGAGKTTGNAIADELNREAQFISANSAPPSRAAGATNASAAAPTAALNQRPNPNYRPNPVQQQQAKEDPRNRVLVEHEVRSAIRHKITSNNLLGLPPAEVESMVDLILAAPSKKEVFDWCSTLMLEEKEAADIINMRERSRIGSFADGGSAAAAAAVPTPSPAAPAPTPAPTPAPSAGPAPMPSLQSLKQQPASSKSANDGPKVLTVGKKGAVQTTNAVGNNPLNNTSGEAAVGSGTKKRGANSKALANLSSMGSNSIVVGKFFECGCFAATHNYISNCLNCGRIFCEQEMPAKAAAVGSYAARAGGITAEDIMCYACGQDPNRNITYEIKMQQGLIDQMAANKAQKGFDEALARRDQLLQFARERSKRTTVVDDQGMGGIAYGTNTAWMTEDEVEAMEEKERKDRIAEMHKHSGAYRIHLDIVNQSVSLGATPSAADTAAAPDGSAAAGAAATPAPNAWAAVPSAKPQGGPAGAEDGEEEEVNGDSDEEYDSDEEGARRVLPLPTLLQKLWYNADENATTSSAAANGGKWDSARVNADGGAAAGGASSRLVAEGPTVLDLKPTTHRGMTASKRVQNDYFEDDDLAYRVEREDFIFKTKKALLAEDAEAEEAKRSGVPLKKKQNQSNSSNGLTSSTAVGPVASASNATIDRESFSANGIGSSDKPDIATINAVGAAMAAGGRVGDDGMCMSMHQPWASLLVAGIKIHEGRSWPSDFKGRLWIHSAAAKYSENEIENIEEQHRNFLRANGTEKEKKFPNGYPTSCLLGYVNVTEVISIEEYNARFPNVETRQELGESGYVFMCEKGARMLPFPLPMDGKHKIYKLDRKIWGAARKQFGEE